MARARRTGGQHGHLLAVAAVAANMGADTQDISRLERDTGIAHKARIGGIGDAVDIGDILALGGVGGELH